MNPDLLTSVLNVPSTTDSFNTSLNRPTSIPAWLDLTVINVDTHLTTSKVTSEPRVVQSIVLEFTARVMLLALRSLLSTPRLKIASAAWRNADSTSRIDACSPRAVRVTKDAEDARRVGNRVEGNVGP